ncbi:hypothetical protein C8F01DRAFT_1245858 [Mycena amicta]|nr:hypothetical protein C8F01DRAFT_1245858 [Mycena amicta]
MSIHNLPLELVALVADNLCVNESITLQLPATQQSSIVVFSEVCAAWRAVAFSLRHLWTNYTLHLRARKSRREQYEWAEQRLMELNSLAGNQGIYLKVVQEDHSYGLSYLVRLLALPWPELTSLVLDIPDQTFVALAKHTSFRFPALKSLTITLHLDAQGNQTLLPRNRILRFFANMPRLRNLELGYHEWRPLAVIIPQFDEWALPLTKLRTFCMPHVWIELPELLDVFKAAPELTMCTAFLDAPPFHEQDNCIPLRLPNLRGLTLTLRMAYPSLWSRFTAPALELLDLCMVTGLDPAEGFISPNNVDHFYCHQPAAKIIVYRLLEYMPA